MTRIIFDETTTYIPTVSRRGARVKAWGGGGGGAGGCTSAGQIWGGGGGGGGAYAQGLVPLTKDRPLPVVVGTGGSAGGSGSSGSAGEASWVGATPVVLAAGGAGGKAINNDVGHIPALGGQAGASKGKLVATGGSGGLSVSTDTDSCGSGGGGAAGITGRGGDGIGGSSFVPGAGGEAATPGGNGGRGADPPLLLPEAPAAMGTLPAGGGGGGGASLRTPAPVMPNLEGTFDVELPAYNPLDGVQYNAVTFTVVADLATLGTYDVSDSPQTLVTYFPTTTWIQSLYADSASFDVADSTGPEAFTPALPPGAGVAYATIADHGASWHISAIFANYPVADPGDLGPHAFTFSGLYWADSALGGESNHATFTFTVRRVIV